ncbi:DNA-directed RNA polymerase subunit L [Methanotrichaceae archaeon M04Ac]|uniref:DNA-directed RNA polymerase subunit Rpo11 n=1 Tax=Candidatus Methanocrinis alkalitolerans TaxID=3033395 RepID=A0ABT5XH91_9EURY|nr:DNA-directed RNA polymerase subunit L [Candidatus Methanocrinis alkalitolerans]MCR3884095.1 DNA-directed RNA polymerase subunit L [Methanothrix sp.]MDF0594091.1 DNA-directed RNA polymerase subunit L [Candidatus Methanocrinis alkalitolerans]
MNVKILKKTEDELHLEFEGDSHTLLNLLRTELLKDDRVLLATYDAKFPMMTNPIFRLKTRKVDPVLLLNEVAVRIAGLCEEFEEEFRAAVG